MQHKRRGCATRLIQLVEFQLAAIDRQSPRRGRASTLHAKQLEQSAIAFCILRAAYRKCSERSRKRGLAHVPLQSNGHALQPWAQDKSWLMQRKGRTPVMRRLDSNYAMPHDDIIMLAKKEGRSTGAGSIATDGVRAASEENPALSLYRALAVAAAH
eukprot:3157867-Pleurochrysis_carterae.AAC.2